MSDPSERKWNIAFGIIYVIVLIECVFLAYVWTQAFVLRAVLDGMRSAR